LKILQLWTESWKTCFFSVLASLMLWYQFVVHTGPKANTKKTQTSRFTWFPKTGYIHGGSRLYINGGMIQTLNSTQYNLWKPVFHSYTLFSQIFTCTHSHSCTHHSSLHTCFLHTQHFLSSALSPVSLFIGEWRSIDSNPSAEPTTTMTKVMVVGERLTKNVDNCYTIFRFS
jgi:hypothetical protein